MTNQQIDRAEQVDVLALIDHFVLGGAETLLPRFAAAAPQAGIALSIACLEELDGNPAAAPLHELGVPPINLHLSGRPGWRALNRVREHITRTRPQLVHTHLPTSDLLGGLAARSLGIPMLSTLHGLPSDGWRPEVYRRALRFSAARVISVSEKTRQEHLRRGTARPDQIVTIHNGIDVIPEPGARERIRRDLGLAPGDLVAVMVSALRPEKGHDVAIEVVRRLRSRFPGLRLVIVGQGALGEEIRRQSADLGDTVVMAGLRHDVMRVLAGADVCLQPSRADAFPTTVLEAMAAGVPVLASAVGGIPEMISHEQTGILVSAPPEPSALAAALARLLEDPMRRAALAAAGRRRYEQQFTAGPWVRRTRALYDTVLAEAAAQRLGRRAPTVRARSAS